MIIIVGPHTSWMDVVVGFAARNQLKIKQAKFLGKKELFEGLFGWFFRLLGGVPVDRNSKQGMVDQVSDLFANHERFLLAMAPEGTRKRVDKMRTGFYHIAKRSKVPILPIGFDFEKKQVIIGAILMPGDDEEKDFKKFIAFFSGIKGKNQALDMQHLKEAE